MFDYTCEHCGYEFFMEEGYERETDTIVCPMCGTIQYEEKGS